MEGEKEEIEEKEKEGVKKKSPKKAVKLAKCETLSLMRVGWEQWPSGSGWRYCSRCVSG